MIDILMATYNGEKYLTEQLDSILAQTYKDWQLIIRDDCSQDSTWSILTEYSLKYPVKIKIMRADVPSGGAAQNFFKLLDYVEHDYVMFCDQDDVWLPDKIAKTMGKMQEMEQEFGNKMPILVHTDLCVVDENLQVINPSLFAMQKMNSQRDKLNNLVVTNIVTGCTLMMNRALCNLLTVKPQKCVMHDMWIALVAAAFGKIGFVKDYTVLYRQHGNNANGAKEVGTWRYLWWRITSIKEIHKTLVERYDQAGEFRRIFGDKLAAEQVEMLECYSRFEQLSIREKIIAQRKYGLRKESRLQMLGQLLR